MIKRRMMFLLFLPVWLQACASVTVDPVESDGLVGSCQKLTQSAYLVKVSLYREGGLVGGRLIIGEEYVRNYDKKIIGRLKEGSLFKVQHIVKDENMTASCWRVEVEILSGDFLGVVSELPACYVNHPPTWLNSDSPRDRSVDKLQIKSEYAETVTCVNE